MLRDTKSNALSIIKPLSWYFLTQILINKDNVTGFRRRTHTHMLSQTWKVPLVARNALLIDDSPLTWTVTTDPRGQLLCQEAA